MSDEVTLRDYLKVVTADLQQARQRLREIEERSQEPVAIVGMGCRFPGGVAGPEDLWELVTAGTDAIGGFPADRGWNLDGLYDPDPDHAGTAYTRHGGFVYDAGDFDPGFFGISPREALAMDPQQRMLLEVCWEALERAGIRPGLLRGSRTGVFAGASSSGYGADLLMADPDAEGYVVTGAATSVLSGRVAFCLGLEGPTMTVDTSCSSALVALHLACQALRAGECTLALAGGVTMMATPVVFVEFSRKRGLAADGRCKAFSADADGTGWAEGAGVVVLELLSQARAAGHRVLAVVRGSAVNQDGASNGLTAPNGASQQRVIGAALAAAGLGPADVDAVEAHGTGTVLGDPIEAQALIAAYGQGRDRPLWLGSVKSNIGHTQQTAGMAGVIKMVLALRHHVLPRTLHVQEPSPQVDWSAGQVRLLTEPVPWPAGGRPRRTGVSAFGMSGTNAHVILEEYPGDEVLSGTAEAVPLVRGAWAWLVSGRSAAGLAGQAGQLAAYVAGQPGLDAGDVGWSLAVTRSVFEHRAVVTGTGRDELAAGLGAVAAGQPAAGVVCGTAAPVGAGKVVFVFPGQGSQWAGMGRELYAASPVFAARLGQCARALAPHVDWDLLEVITGTATAPGLETAQVVQPVLWAVMVALAAVWEAAGVVPDAVIGHSQGEIAAACVAGMLSLDDAAHVVAVRSRALSGLGEDGGMVSVVMPEAGVRDLINRWGGRLSVAAVNSPAATVVSGDRDALAELGAELSARHVLRWPIPDTDFVAHSARAEELAGLLTAALAPVRPTAGRVRLYSTVTGRWMDGPELDARYWYANVRETVRFADAVTALAGQGCKTFIEISPHPVLEAAVADTIEQAGLPAPVTSGTLHRDSSGAAQILTALARAHVRGVAVDWAAVLGGGRTVDLPTYAFQRQRYWPAARSAGTGTVVAGGDGAVAEARFWAAVQGGDVPGLARALAVDGQVLGPVLPALAAWRARERDRSVTGTWRYQVSWVPVTGTGPGRLTGTWLIITPHSTDEDLTAQCERVLQAGGAQVITVTAGAGAGDLDRAVLAARLTQALAGDAAVAGVVSLLGLAEEPLEGCPGVAAGLAGTLALIQALGDAGAGAPLWAITCGAVAAGTEQAPARPVQAMIWGLGRVAALEHPDRWGGLIDVPPVLDARAAGRLCAVLAGCGEDQAAIRAAGIFGRRLARAPRPGPPRAWVPRGSVLITGGTGAIGARAARWVAGRGAPALILASRSGPAAPGTAALAAALAAAGSAVTVTACDTARRDQLAGLLDAAAAAGPPLTAVLHAAGVIDDGLVDGLGPDRLAAVLAAKAGGAALLDELTAGLDLDAFVLFSSVAAVFGGAGQGNYAAANAFLDALAQDRQARGLPALSVAWGPWAGAGMTSQDSAARLQRRGLTPMNPAPAIRALAQAIDHGEQQLTIAQVDWARFCAVPGAARVPFVRDLPETRQHAPAPAAGAGAELPATELARRLAGAGRAGQDQMILDLIRAGAAQILGHSSPGAIDADRPFSDLGFDSVTALELRQHLSGATGLRLPATLLFNYPTPVVLAGYLREELLGTQAGRAAAAGGVLAVSAGRAAGEPVAIVGMGCRYPGGVSGPEDLWELVAAGTDAIGGFPQDRGWDLNGLYDPDPDRPGTSYMRGGGFVHEAGDFDAGFFGISPREALAMDPQQRLLLEVCWEALERAGIDPARLRGTRAGVFAGGYFSGYAIGVSQHGEGELEGYMMAGNAASVLSGRVAYVLGLEGPAVTVDTACSSSLVALHLACQALRAGECTLALAGGVTIMATPADLVSFSRQRGVAPDGRSKAFSAAADGMGMGEGVGMIVLERLCDARAAGHRVLAVIRGSAVNQDGASNGLTAPNGPSQQRVIEAALAAAGLSAADVDALEAHGTGTALGDPIEAQALIATYGQDRDRPAWLGSVKSNIGHAQGAAGVAGVIKMVLALRHQVLPRTLHADEPSPHVDWAAGQVQLVTEPVPWPDTGRPRRAAVSSFGISGTNAHLILEQPPAPGRGDADPGTDTGPDLAAEADAGGTGAVLAAGAGGCAWLVSGRSAAGLAGQAGRLAGFVAGRPDLDPADMGWSLAISRSVFEHRAVVVGADRDELLVGLGAVAAGQPAPGLMTGMAGGPGLTGFVFAGQGSQRAGMGRELYAASPVFAAEFDKVAALLEDRLGIPVREVVLARADDERADQTLFAQPGLFAVQAALVAVLAAAGITPGAVAGHSVGEVAAAYAAGVLGLEDACALVAARAELMQALPAGGVMTAVAAGEDEVAEVLAGQGAVAIAAVNGPASVVISGPGPAVRQAAQTLAERGRRVRQLRVSHAFHSPLMDPMLDELGRQAAGLAHRPPDLVWASTLTGELTTGCDPRYWVRQAREPVRFAAAVTALGAAGVRTFIEIGPDATLSALGPAALPGAGEQGGQVAFIPLLRPGTSAPRALLTALARAHVHGITVDWAAVLGGGRTVDLPTYAFQRQRYWPVPRPAGTGTGVAGGDGAVAEARFWAAVQGGDVPGLARELAVDGQLLGPVLPALAAWRARERDRSVTGSWRYQVSWVPVADPGPGRLSGTWLVITPASETADLAAQCVQALAGGGARVITVTAGAGDLDRAVLAARLTQALAGAAEDGQAAEAGQGGQAAEAARAAGVAGVVSLLGLAEEPLAGCPGVAAGLAGTLALIQALGDIQISAPLWAITCGAVAAGTERAPARPVQAMIWGLGRVAALEHPDRWGGLIDVPPVLDARAAGRLCAVLAGCGEDQAAIRAAGIFGRRLARAPRPGPPRAWVPRGSVLITGGTGAIGARTARWVAGRGAPALILASRSGPAAPGTAALAAALAAAGSAVTVTACDTARRDQLAGLLDAAATGGPPLTAVLHTAGVIDDGLVDGLGPDRLAAVLAAKAGGAALLDELTAGYDLDAFVLFSSVAAVFGGAGQGNYAAANAFLDALAQDRQARGLPALSVAWGPWASAGMAQASEAVRQRLRRGPLPDMDPVLAVQALGQALEGTAATVAVMDVDWARFCAVPGAARAPFVRDLPETRQHAPAPATGVGAELPATELARRLAGAGRAGQDQMILDLIRAGAAQILGHSSPGAIDADRPFSDQGFDSLTALELSQHLSGATGLKLPASLLFDYPSPIVLAGHLQSRLFPETEDGGADVDEAAIRRALASIPLAQFRSAGVMDVLLRLANLHDGAEVEAAAVSSRIDSIREMDAESLIQMALGDDDS